MRVEIRQVIFDDSRAVALGIDGDEQGTSAIGIGSERMQHLRDLEQRRRANIGAMGEPEEHQEWASLHILIGEGLAVLVFEMERAADRRDRGANGRRRASGDEQDGAKKQKQPAEKRGEQKHDARCVRLHERFSVSQSRRQSRREPFRRTRRCRNEPTAPQCRPAPERLARWRRTKTQKLAVGRGVAAWR